MIIDTHHHILPPAYVTAIGPRIGPQGLMGPAPRWSPALSIEVMDRNGITSALTSISAPGVWFGDVGETRRLARQCNEYAARLKADHPGRFGMLAVLPLPDIEGSLSEIAYALDVLKAEGFGLLTNYDGRYPGDAAFRPVLDELNRRKAVVFFHPTNGPYKPLPEDVPPPSLEFPFDTTRAITNLLFTGTFGRCREARFIFAHAGGAVPFLAERIARLMIKPEFKANVPDGVYAEVGRLFYDTALSANRLIFGPLRQLVPMTNILFGSDFPHAGEPTLAATIGGLRQLDLTPQEVRAIERENAARLFPTLVR